MSQMAPKSVQPTWRESGAGGAELVEGCSMMAFGVLTEDIDGVVYFMSGDVYY